MGTAGRDGGSVEWEGGDGSAGRGGSKGGGGKGTRCGEEFGEEGLGLGCVRLLSQERDWDLVIASASRTSLRICDLRLKRCPSSLLDVLLVDTGL